MRLLLLAALLTGCPGEKDTGTGSGGSEGGSEGGASEGGASEGGGSDGGSEGGSEEGGTGEGGSEEGGSEGGDSGTGGETDADGDGYTASAGDCDDTDPDQHPGATEDCDDGADNDCNALLDCEDASCTAACGESDCADGVDNDGDSTTDCADDDCWGSGCPMTYARVLGGFLDGERYHYDEPGHSPTWATWCDSATQTTNFRELRVSWVYGTVRVDFTSTDAICDWSVTGARFSHMYVRNEFHNGRSTGRSCHGLSSIVSTHTHDYSERFPPCQ